MSGPSDHELERRLTASAPAAPACSIEPQALARSVLKELQQRRARRKARTSVAAALLLALATGAWWARTSGPADRPAISLTEVQPAASPDELDALRGRIELQRWLIDSIEQAERVAHYEQRLAAMRPIDDPFRATRVELERAAWLMLDDAERGAAGASPGEKARAYDAIRQTFSGTYWAGVAGERRQQLLGATGT